MTDLEIQIRMADKMYKLGHINNDSGAISEAVEMMDEVYYEITMEEISKLSDDTSKIMEDWGYILKW